MSARSQRWHWIASHAADVLLIGLLVAVLVVLVVGVP